MSPPIALSVDVLAGALGTVCIRGLLNIADRTALGYRQVSLALTLLCSAVFPLVLMLGILPFMGGVNHELWALLFHPAVIFNGLLTHCSASVFYRGYRDLPVRSVSALAKLADLFLPMVVIGLGHEMALNDALFAVLSTALFLPFLKGLRWRGSKTAPWVLIFLALMPVAQTCTNYWTGTTDLTQNLLSFAQFFTAMTVWRVVAMMVTNAQVLWQEFNQNAMHQLQFIPMLAGRAVVSVIAQALFFFAITREAGVLAWPIINAGPLLSSLFAHWILRERLRRLEGVVLAAFGAALVFCLLLKASIPFAL